MFFIQNWTMIKNKYNELIRGLSKNRDRMTLVTEILSEDHVGNHSKITSVMGN